MYLLGIDLGTTGCKSILFTVSGAIAAEAYVEYPLIHTPEGYIEQDADLWWTLVTQVVRNTVAQAGVRGEEVAALAVSSQGMAFVPVDAAGRSLDRAISWLDMRPVGEEAFLREYFGEREMFERSGKRINPVYSLPKWMWLKARRPDVYKGADKFLMGLEYINYRLTGRALTDYSMASGTLAFSLRERRWDEEMLEQCGVDPAKLPEAAPAGTVVGTVLPDVAAAMGLSPRTLVVLGSQDQKCAAAGAGIAEGVCTASLGTATAIETVGREPMLDHDMRIPCFVLDETRWVLEAVLSTSGASLKWLRGSLFPDKSYQELDELVAAAPAGAGGVYFYPHLEGAASPYWDMSAKGFMYGMGLGTGSGDIARALYEGVAFQMRANIAVLEQLGPPLSEIRAFGGGAKGEVWCRIIADITGKTVATMFTPEMANFGAARIAGQAVGADPGSGAEQVTHRFEPDAERHARYCEIFEKYITIQGRILK